MARPVAEGDDWWRGARTLLFTPGTRADRFDKARASGADGVVVDLEDSVAVADKETARQAVDDFLDAGHPRVVVRVNGADSPWWDDDLAMVGDRAAVMVPKSTPDGLARAARTLPGALPLFGLVETPRGVMELGELRRVRRALRLCFGGIDYALALGVPESEGPLADDARIRIAIASSALGLPAPVDGVTADLADEEALRRTVAHVRGLGFTGKLVVHPRQVGPVHDALDPTAEEVARARRVLAAGADVGVGVVDGTMVDRPVVERARRLLDLAGEDPP